MTAPSSVFALPDRLAAKADPRVIGPDADHFARVRAALEHSLRELDDRLAAALAAPAGPGQASLDRDQEVHRTQQRRALLQRFGLDLVLGRMVSAGEEAPLYIGRLNLVDADGERLLVDWRTPAAAPFFAATLADPQGLLSRRRYRWTRGRVTDFWDEILDPDALAAAGRAAPASLDDQAAFIASLGAARTPRMRDVLGTIQADQDAVIRATARGVRVVDGGPGTGKTVVALHRAAYLLHADPRISRHEAGVLFVGPSREFLHYVADVLPGLGEEGARLATLRDLVPEGAAATPERDGRVAAIKDSGVLTSAVDAAVRRHEVPPQDRTEVETPWGTVVAAPAEWQEAFDAAEPGVPHDAAREQVWHGLLDVLVDRVRRDDPDVPAERLRRAIQADEGLRRAMAGAWPLLDPAGVVADLLSVPSYLAACAPALSAEQRTLLTRDDARAWTVSDLPLLDHARRRIGDPDEARQRRRRAAALEAERARVARLVDDVLAAEGREGRDLMEGPEIMLRGEDLQEALIDDGVLPELTPDELEGPFAHVVVDEAQELTDAEWAMILRRCPSRSLTVVGDRAQARHGFAESWTERLARVGLAGAVVSELRINYRTPEEVMAEAEPVIRAVLPDANVPAAVRSSGIPVRHGAVADLVPLLEEWLADEGDGIGCVIAGDDVELPGLPELPGAGRLRRLRPEQAKGLEFDTVVLVEGGATGTGAGGPAMTRAVDRYVAMTRATRRLVILR